VTGRIAGGRKVEYLKRVDIKSAALRLLTAYGKKFETVLAPPIPVDEILESHLELDLRFDNLPRLLAEPRALGATWVVQRRVRIDESLDPSVYPAMEGRYRFTPHVDTDPAARASILSVALLMVGLMLLVQALSHPDQLAAWAGAAASGLAFVLSERRGRVSVSPHEAGVMGTGVPCCCVSCLLTSVACCRRLSCFRRMSRLLTKVASHRTPRPRPHFRSFDLW